METQQNIEIDGHHPVNAGVSIYIPTHNRAQLLKRAVFSALAQENCDLEVIIVDDASTDRTPEIIDQLAADPRVRSIRLTRPRGAPFARNTAIDAARHRFVTGLDDDDMFLPGRLQRLLEAAKRSPGAAYASNDLLLTPSGLRLHRKPSLVSGHDLRYVNIIGNQILAERSAFLAAGLFDITLKAGQDYEMWGRILKHTLVCHIDSRPGQLVDAAHGLGSISHLSNKAAAYSEARRKIARSLSLDPDKDAVLRFLDTGSLTWASTSALLSRLIDTRTNTYAKISLIREALRTILKHPART